MATSLSDIMGIKDPFAQNVLKASKAKGEVEAAEKQEKAYGQQEMAKAEAATTEQFAKEREPTELKQKYEKTIDELGQPFIPTQQTAGDLGNIFAMTNILGFLIGGGAKGSAQAALSAQNGMLEGYQKGQMDVYKKQKDIFDENQKSLSKAVEGLRDELKRAADTASVNKELGLAQARQAIANHQAKQMGEYLDKMGVAATYELSEKAWQINEKLKAEKRAEEDRAERRSIEKQRLTLEQNKASADKFVGFTEDGKNAVFTTIDGRVKIAPAPEGVDFSKVLKVGEEAQIESKERQAMLNRISKENIVNQQIAAREKLQKAKELTGGKLKPGAKIAEGYVADLQLQQDLTDLRNDLKDSKLVNQIKDYRAEAFLSEEGKVLNQLMTSDIPPELSKFLNKVSQVRNNYYLNISGKAVTGGEALRNYGVVSQPGDTPEKMAIKMDSMLENVEQNIDTKRQLFTLPEVKRKPGQKTNLSLGQDYNTSETTSAPSKTSGGATVSNW